MTTYTVSHLEMPDQIVRRDFYNPAVAMIEALMMPGITDALVSFIEDGHTWVLVTKPAKALATGKARFVSDTLTETIDVYPDRKPDEPDYGLIIGYSSQAPAISDFMAREMANVWINLAQQRGQHVTYTSSSLVWEWVRVVCIERDYDFRKVIVVLPSGTCVRLNHYCAEIGNGNWKANTSADAAEIILRNASRMRNQQKAKEPFEKGTHIRFTDGQWKGQSGKYMGIVAANILGTGPNLHGGPQFAVHHVILDEYPNAPCIFINPDHIEKI